MELISLSKIFPESLPDPCSQNYIYEVINPQARDRDMFEKIKQYDPNQLQDILAACRTLEEGRFENHAKWFALVDIENDLSALSKAIPRIQKVARKLKLIPSLSNWTKIAFLISNGEPIDFKIDDIYRCEVKLDFYTNFKSAQKAA